MITILEAALSIALVVVGLIVVGWYVFGTPK